MEKKEPMFQFSNFFKPTTKNVTLLGLAMRASAISILASSFSSQSIKVFAVGLIIGFVGEFIVLLSKEDPIETIVKAAEDIQQTTIQETQPVENVSN